VVVAGGTFTVVLWVQAGSNPRAAQAKPVMIRFFIA
jgi:hypothetical protein